MPEAEFDVRNILNNRVIVSSLARRKRDRPIKPCSTMLRIYYTYQACWLTSVTWGVAIIKACRGGKKMAGKSRTGLFKEWKPER